ncbi:protein aspartic protease in guard cell 1 [Quercus suber]|uniref:Protein aspartic protease in guard cell 1 n=1 Tax=Quercus suber TaxID=58331 RepID=A0AAW0KX02_QUESU
MSSLFYIIIIIFSTLNFVHSRTLTETTSSTTTLDVTTSLQKTQSVFSRYNPKATPQAFNQQKQKQTQTQTQTLSSSSLTLELHTRASILSRPTHTHTHTDYKSLTIARLERDSARLKSLTTRVATVAYGDGSYTVGDFVTETLTLGSASVNNVAIGCGHNNEGLFIGAAGLLGLGGGRLSFPSQLNATSFSYCLVDRDSDSASTLEFNSPLPPNAVTAPLHRNPKLDTFYYVGVSGLSVGGESLRIPESAFEVDSGGNGGIIIDSGTAVSRLRTETYNSLRDAFVKGTRRLGLASTNGVALFDTCYDLSSKTSVEVPTVAFHFPNGKVLALAAKNVLIPVDSTGTFCLAFAPTSSAFSIIGNVQQQQTRVAFDLANSLIGFSSTKC